MRSRLLTVISSLSAVVPAIFFDVDIQAVKRSRCSAFSWCQHLGERQVDEKHRVACHSARINCCFSFPTEAVAKHRVAVASLVYFTSASAMDNSSHIKMHCLVIAGLAWWLPETDICSQWGTEHTQERVSHSLSELYLQNMWKKVVDVPKQTCKHECFVQCLWKKI